MTQQLIDAAKALLADIASNPAVPQFSFVATGRVLELRAAVEAAEKQEPTTLPEGWDAMGAEFKAQMLDWQVKGEFFARAIGTMREQQDEIAKLKAQQEASSYYVSVITTAYEQGFGKAWKGDTVKNPYAPGNGFEAWDIGYREGAMRRQQAGDNAPVAQQEAKPLSGEQLRDIARTYKSNDQQRMRDHWDLFVDFARAIEAAHGIKSPELPAESPELGAKT